MVSVGSSVTSAALIVGLLIATVGIIGAVAPFALMAAARHAVTPLGLYLAAAVRVSFGVVLLRAAPASRAAKILRVFGAIVLLNGLITPLVGVDRAQAILAWWVAQGPAIMRVWAAGAVALGVLVVYAVVPDRRAV